MLSNAQLPSAISRLILSPRAIPFAIASVICIITSILLGYGAWYVIGDHRPPELAEKPEMTSTAPVAPAVAESSEPRIVIAPAGELIVPRGTVTLSGDQERPVRMITLEAFAIAETEVTNDQYFQFVREANHTPPPNWTQAKYAAGTGSEPVIYVSWNDAVAYCDWLSGKIGATVRLPTEAQWELAARGPGGLKYPWGNEWQDDAAAVEKKGQVRPVKSYPVNRSPYGAYDMAGNVWEWVANPGHDADGFPVAADGVEYRMAKGGSANEPAEFITSTVRVKLRGDLKDKYLGFRYVVLRPANAQLETRAEGANDTAGATNAGGSASAQPSKER